MEPTHLINVEIVYANLQQQQLITLQVPSPCSLNSALDQSGILKQFPEINLLENKVGIFGKCVSLETILQDGDRIEIYCPLTLDPKQIRKQRAKKVNKTF